MFYDCMHEEVHLAGVVEVEPAFKVDGVPSRYQTPILKDPQFDRSVAACGDDVMEGVFESHRVIVGPLVLRAKRTVK